MSMVLVVDDKELMRDSVASTLQRAGLVVATASDGEAAVALIAKRRPDAVITDLKMPGLTGMELLDRIRAIDADLPVIVMTAFGTIDTAVRAMKAGAFDYITKPFEGDELLISVKRAIQHGRLIRDNAVLTAETDSPEPARDGAPAGARGLDRVVGASPAMRRVKEQVAAVAGSHGTVLICGESGVGKEVIARAIHDLSPRAGAPLLGVNCAALSESLLESELFGHERGAFTGADKMRKGRFELADSGTLLLDEVSEVSPNIQAKLLRVLQERAFERVGSSQTIGVDVRVVATSNRDLPRAVASGQFRQDLFFRLNVLPIHVPPLRDRLEDVALLADFFVRSFCAREGRPPIRFDDGATQLLQAYSWPGNVRELQNICERAVVLLGGRGRDQAVITRQTIEPWLLGHGSGSNGIARGILETKPMNGHAANGVHGLDGENGRPMLTVPSDTTLEVIEREVIVQTLRRFNGHRQKTARALGIGVRTLGLKLKKWKELQLVAPTL